MSKTVEKNIAAALDDAERRGACCAPEDRLMREAMRSRKNAIVEPVRGLFFRSDAWESLEPPEKTLHLMRALAPAHPTWRFCGASAAVAYGLPVTWSLLSNVFVATPSGASYRSCPGIVRRHLSDDAAQVRDGLPLVPFWRTVFDCLAALEAPDALAIADAALQASGMSPHGLTELLGKEFRGHRGVRRAIEVATLADARAESGGESIARAVMRQLGFALPELQVWIEDPVEPGKWFRVDFLWLTEDGRLIIGELDGRQKTERPELMGGRDALRVMQDERLRESHLTALRPAIIRFPYEVARDPNRLGPLLEHYGVPHDANTWPTAAPEIVTRSSRLDYAAGPLRVIRAQARI